jgi:hypothetical protein
MNLNGHEIRLSSLEVDGVDINDYPDFCDAYFCYAEYTNGIELTDDELEQLTDQYGDVVHELAYDSIVC